MDSQGRKVVVCDNGTGVSFRFVWPAAVFFAALGNPVVLFSSSSSLYTAPLPETGSVAVSAHASWLPSSMRQFKGV